MCCCGFTSIKPFFIKSHQHEEQVSTWDSGLASVLTPEEMVLYRRLIEEQCCVCLEVMSVEENQQNNARTWYWWRCPWITAGEVVTVSCSHKFHKNCIKLWFKYSLDKTCPLCRKLVTYRD